MESVKCSHVIIQEVELRSRWNWEQRNLSARNSNSNSEKTDKSNPPDYSWLMDNKFQRGVNLLCNACQALHLRTLSSNLRLEDTATIIKIFRSHNSTEFGLEQLVNLMADILMSYVDERQRIQLLRKRDQKSSLPRKVLSMYTTNRVAPQRMSPPPESGRRIHSTRSIFALSSSAML